MEPAAKRARSSKVIGTHSGSFHADEALAVFLLRQTNEYRDAELIRTRDGKTLDELDIVVDVGGIYDAVKQRYDHHQRGFEEVFGNGDPEVKSPPTSDPSSSVPTPWFTTKLSSAGLVYKHFGREVISNVTGLPQSDKRVQILWIKLYKEFIEAIDGIDNGVEQYGAGAKALYSSRTNLSARVGWLNPRWNEPSNDSLLDEKFKEASKLAGSEFMDRLDYYFKAWLPARDVVEKALLERESIDPSGQIVAFSQVSRPVGLFRSRDVILTVSLSLFSKLCDLLAVGSLEGTHLRTRANDVDSQADRLRFVPGRLGEPSWQVEDSVCPQGRGDVREQKEHAGGLERCEG